MSNCGCHSQANTKTERKILIIALILNISMFVVGLIAGFLAQSTSLIADSLDMLADASAYTIGLLAIGRSLGFKAKAAALSGSLLFFLGVGVLIEVVRRALLGSSPEGITMIVVACMSLTVNSYVLQKISQFRHGEVHLRATWLFTRADIVVNLGVLVSGLLVAFTHSSYPDLIVGFAIGLYVIKEALEILKSAKQTRVL
jgi:cation diffusion facilitator family transporter